MKLAPVIVLFLIRQLESFAGEPVRQIVVSIPDRKLVLLEDREVKKIYEVAVGKPATPSPVGTFHIASRVINPTWYGPKVVVPPGKANPLGTRWMGLGYKGYGIHGTNAPKSIGKAASHGCVRMRVKDAQELFALMSVGDQVDFFAERTGQVALLLDQPSPAAPVIAGIESAGGAQ